ncbi:DUF5671 domain-containing protein [Pseudonocardia acaciae]|uniref:DUF5671 domain-containing protein n=1 Tax=Pseudonocardia acaciae TaxID=551276 RepID=UPI00048FE311|nr:DUF5671 domain-containing protein [Pseudonocardia acaciae]
MSTDSIRPTTRAFGYVLTLLSMGITVTALGAVLHNLVDIAFGYTRGTDGLVTWAASTLVVALPIFVGLFFWLRRAEAAETAEAGEAGELDRGSRLAVQVTLVVAFLWAVSRLVRYVYSVLNAGSGEPGLGSNIGNHLGNLTHTAITVGLAGAVFWYWRAAPRPTGFRRTALVTGLLAAGCVVAVVGQSLLAVSIRADAATEDRIRTLAAGVENHARTTGAPPPSLDGLGLDTTGVRYAVTGPRTFELCATFATSSADPYPRPRPRPVGYVDPSVHPAGEVCFPASVSPAP